MPEKTCLVDDKGLKRIISIKKIWRVTGSKYKLNLNHAYEQAGKSDLQVKRNIKETIQNCNIFKKYKRSQGILKVAIRDHREIHQVHFCFPFRETGWWGLRLLKK